MRAGSSLCRISNGLSKGDKLASVKTHGLRQGLLIHCAAKHRCESFRCAEQIDILSDEAGVGRCIETPIIGRDILHPFAVCDIHEI